jgi:hypothetical protein
MNNNWPRTLFLAMACFLCVAGYARASERASFDARSSTGTARLIVYRIPNIGRNLIAQLYVDDVIVGAIGYGQTYEGVLTCGQHVLSALATPRPKWRDRPPTIVDVRAGRTYRFTVMGNGSGNLILWNDADTRPPRVGVFPRPADTAAR